VIESVFPRTEIQLCIVHLVRNSLRYVSWKDRKAVARDLFRQIYNAPTVEAAEQALTTFEAKWAERFPVIGRIWRDRWQQVIPLFGYPEPIRRAIYTTNAIESLNASLRRVTKKRGAFPTQDSVRKVLFLAIQHVSERWTRLIKNWTDTLNYFAIAFDSRVRL
jgi:putative transposase